MARCTSCGADVRWLRTRRDRRMIVNATPDPQGNVVAVDGVADVRPPNPTVPDPERAVRYRPHWADCPNAAQHRSRR